MPNNLSAKQFVKKQYFVIEHSPGLLCRFDDSAIEGHKQGCPIEDCHA